MAVFRVVKNKNYTTICNEHLKDKRLSLKAKGLLTIMLSLREDWDYSVNGLVSICKEGKGAVETALRELKECGYLEIVKITPKDSKSGRFEYQYNIYESSVEFQETRPQKQGARIQETRPQKQGARIQGVENPPQLNTKELRDGQKSESVGCRDFNENELFPAIETESKGRFAPPTRDEVEAYAREKGYNGFPVDRFIAYYESNGWMVGRTKMKSWRAAMTNWHLRGSFGSGSNDKRGMVQAQQPKVSQAVLDRIYASHEQTRREWGL